MKYISSVTYLPSKVKKMAKQNLQIVVWKENDHYISKCIDVNVSSFGKTKKEALDMLKDALKLYFESEDNIRQKEEEFVLNEIKHHKETGEMYSFEETFQ